MQVLTNKLFHIFTWGQTQRISYQGMGKLIKKHDGLDLIKVAPLHTIRNAEREAMEAVEQATQLQFPRGNSHPASHTGKSKG